MLTPHRSQARVIDLKTALITGITGQDGAYLAQLLLGHGYRVVGLVRRSSRSDVNDAGLRWLGIAREVAFVSGDMCDLSSLLRVLRAERPDEIYNLAAQSQVPLSWQQPLLTGQVTGLGAANLLEGMRAEAPQARFYQASSSEMFGPATSAGLDELTPFHPRSPYAAAKLYAHWMTINYRQNYGLHASCGVLSNHESPLRGTEFVTRKITDGVARIKLGLARSLQLGNLDSTRDWGHARDYMEAVWRMVQQDTPDDYVIATGRAATVREFCRIAFAHVGLPMEPHLVVDPALFRRVEAPAVVGNPVKARKQLGWAAATTLEALIAEMVDADLSRLAGAPTAGQGRLEAVG